MKNIYFVQPNNNLANSIFLPYSTGTIAAYSFSHDNIKKSYNLKSFIFEKEDINKVMTTVNMPYLIGFSNYMWNIEYNIALAKAIKNTYPNCIIVFGGPQIPDNFDLLKEYDFIDILMHGEGEISFYELLVALDCNKNISNVPNISYRNSGNFKRTKSLINESLDEFPSPYTMGLFDDIINDEKYKNIQFDAIIETNRGCPYKCIYCSWSDSEEIFRKFPLRRVKDDLKWMAEHKISFCICADSNFGLLERDEQLAEYVVELKKIYGYPEKFETTAAKNKNDLTFRINSKLESAKLNRGISLAVQSFSPEVLKIVGRQNMSYDTFAKELERYRNNNMYTYTDLILGLPGETLDSFCKGLFAVIEAGQHNSININRCELLPNTKMYKESFVQQHKIKTIKSYHCQNHSKIDENLIYSSRSELIIETATMSASEWRKALLISICVQSFHGLGLLKFFAIYLRKAKNISYYQFYMNLYKWIENKSKFIKNTLYAACKSIDSFLEQKDNLHFSDKRFGDIYWDFQEGLFLLCVVNINEFFEEIKLYVSEYFDDNELFNDLFNYQKEMIALPEQDDKELETIYSWTDYFNKTFDINIKHPEKKKNILKIKTPHINKLDDYAKEIVWYGRRNGKTINEIIAIN